MQICHRDNLGNSGVANATRRIVDDAAQRLLVVRIGHNSEIGNDILYLLALVKRQTAIYTIWNTVFTHLLFERTALCIGTVKYGEITVLTAIFPTDALNIVANDDGFLLVAVGRLQGEALALLVLTEDIFANLALIFSNKAVGSLDDKLC